MTMYAAINHLAMSVFCTENEIVAFARLRDLDGLAVHTPAEIYQSNSIAQFYSVVREYLAKGYTMAVDSARTGEYAN